MAAAANRDFLSVTSISYAQNFEDVMLARALADVQVGFYVDVGAQDPVIDSVTRWFYERGWSGINIEPVAHWYERLQAARDRDTNLMCAVASIPGTLEMYESSDSGLSTTSEDYARAHMAEGREMHKRSVSARRLDDILAEYAPSTVHFLKIDVEGMEADVLASLSLRRYRPWILVVEATRPNTSIDISDAWEEIVLAADYRLVYRDGLNRFYLAEEQISLASAFAVPPNVFDDFIHYREHAANEYAESLEDRARELHDTTMRLRKELVATENVVNSQQTRLVELDAALQERQALLEETARRAEAWRVDLLNVAETAEAQKVRLAELDELVRERQSVLEETARQAEARREHVVRLEAELEEVHRRELGIRQDLLRAQQDMEVVTQAAENRRVLAEQLDARLREVDAQLRHAAFELHAASVRTTELQSELGSVYASRSWRLTAPMRSFGRLVRSLVGSMLRAAAGVPLLRRAGARILTGPVRYRVLRLAGFAGEQSVYAGENATQAPAVPVGSAPRTRSAARVYRLLEQAQAKPPHETDEDPH